MPDSKNEKVYLLPRTIDFYQKELTRMLEFERYGEAADQLRFLLACETGEPRAKEEWQSLLDWIVTVFPETREQVTEPDELLENDLFRAHIQDKTSHEPEYAEQLLDIFRQPGQWDKQVLALEQLRYLDHPETDRVVLDWLQGRPLPPSLQFRALQILKLRGAKGSARLRHREHTYVVQIEDVPAGFDEYPIPYQEVLHRVMREGAHDGIPLEEFAGQTWSEYVAYVFGTPQYLELLTAPMEAWDAWAAAFHYMLLITAHGSADAGEIKEMYGITGKLEKDWQQASARFEEFAEAVFPSLS